MQEEVRSSLNREQPVWLDHRGKAARRRAILNLLLINQTATQRRSDGEEASSGGRKGKVASGSSGEQSSYLHNGMPPRGRLDRAPASLRLVVSPVVRLGLHLDAELVLVGAAGDGPLQRGQRGHGDAERFTRESGERRKGVKTPAGLRRRGPYLQMLGTIGLCHIGGMTKNGSAALALMSWSKGSA